MRTFVSVAQDLGLLVARLALGGILILHGVDRWQRGIGAEVAFFTQFATPYPEVVAWAVLVIELLGGVCLVLGALTPLVAALVVAEQVVLICYTNWFAGPSLFSPDRSYAGGYEYNVALAALALLLTVFGAGRIAVDRSLRRRLEAEDEAPTRSSRSNLTRAA